MAPLRSGSRITAFLGASLACALPAQSQAQDGSRELLASSGARAVASLGDLYEEGVRLRDQGRWEEALDVWERATEELAGAGVRDPRIGLAYVELATEKEAHERYGDASDLLLWSLSGVPVEGSRTALEAELERVLLLLEDEEREAFEALRDAGDRQLLLTLKRFWLERDPTPATTTNERLIEHWRRIHVARSRYVYNRSSPIDTDDRGVVFLKYGPPARTKRGSLGASEFELQVRVPWSTEERSRLRQYDPNPQYEVWVYDRLNDEGFTYFLFGNIDGTGPFELVDGVHELITPASRSRASARYTPGGIPVSYYLELFYYQDLSAVGGHFGSRFAELDQLWNLHTATRRGFVSAGRAAPSESALDARHERWRQEDRYFPPHPPEAPVRSEFEGRARDELVSQMIRTLSEDDVPLLVVLSASAPRMGADNRAAYDQRLDLPGWTMRHTLIIRDRELDEVGRLVQSVSARNADLSTFAIRHVDQPLHLTVTAQTLREAREEDEGRSDTLVVSDRLPGQVHLVPGSPLSTDPERFEVSDVLVGTPVPPGIDGSSLPYDILPSRRIWRRDPLRVYLEGYHMGRAGGAGHLEARFRVVALDRDGEPRGDVEAMSLSWSAEPTEPVYRRSFDIAMHDQEPGRYRLEVEITDRARGQTVVRQITFELVD